MSESTPTLLLVHGAWHGAWCWEERFAPYLRQHGLQVQTIDLPGHGRQDTRRIPWFSVRDYADAVETQIQASSSPIVVAGHSMGGFVVQKVMERQPPNLAGAALFGAAPPWGVFSVVWHLLRSRPIDLGVASLGFNLYHLVREPRFAQALFYSASMPESEVRQYWAKTQNESFRAFLDMLALDLPKPAKADPKLPKWVIGGEHDTIFPPDVVRRTATAYGAEATIYPNMAHNLMLDAGWEKVADDLNSWISSLS